MINNENQNIDPKNAIYEIVMKYMLQLQFEPENLDYLKFEKHKLYSDI